MVPTLKKQTEAKWNLGRNECLHKVWEQFNLSGSSVCGILPAMEWVAIPFSRGSSQPRDGICVSCIADRFFTIWASKEDLENYIWGVCVCVYIYINVYVHILYIYLYVHIYVYVYMYIYYIYLYVHLYVHICTYKYIYIIYVHIHIYKLYTHTHTHTHTHTESHL